MLRKKIVIAEDDDAIAHMLNMALGDGGYLCVRARSGDEALRMVRLHTPDLLILDIMMPSVDGFEVARRLRADVILSATPILMLTALGSVDHKVQGLEAGADDYMAKPFDLRELTARVRALIRAARRERDRNPTTSLPGTASVEQHIEDVLKGESAAAVLHFDIRDFDHWADQVGYARAEQFVAALGETILDSTRAAGEGFLGHMGGADFIAVTSLDQAEALARAAIERFDQRKAGWIEGGAAGLAMAIAVSTTEGLPPGTSEELSERLAAAMRTAKQGEASNFVVWRPTAS
jgi:DNA-binding response OmpR family regulator